MNRIILNSYWPKLCGSLWRRINVFVLNIIHLFTEKLCFCGTTDLWLNILEKRQIMGRHVGTQMDKLLYMGHSLYCTTTPFIKTTQHTLHEKVDFCQYATMGICKVQKSGCSLQCANFFGNKGKFLGTDVKSVSQQLEGKLGRGYSNKYTVEFGLMFKDMMKLIQQTISYGHQQNNKTNIYGWDWIDNTNLYTINQKAKYEVLAMYFCLKVCYSEI